jgi:hypothetical protein
MVVKAKASAALVVTRRANGKIVIDYSFKRTLRCDWMDCIAGRLSSARLIMAARRRTENAEKAASGKQAGALQ